MGKQTNIRLKGTAANLIYYKWRDIDCIRTKPDQVKQATASKAAGHRFGKANTTESALRTALEHLLPNAKDKDMQRRFAKPIYRWLLTDPLHSSMPVNQLPFITGFEFNEKSLLEERLRLPLTVNRTAGGKLLLQVPAYIPTQTITAPAYTVTMLYRVTVLICRMDKPAITQQWSTAIAIPYTSQEQPAQEILLNVAPAAGCLTVVAAALEYRTSKAGKSRKATAMRWLPAAVLTAMYN